MQVEILRIEECPSWRQAEAAVRIAAERLGLADLDVVVRVIRTADDAVAAGFAGSPTIIADGHHLFGGEPTSELACRIYWTDRGPAGAPTVDQLIAALEPKA